MNKAELIFPMSEYTKKRYLDSGFTKDLVVVKSGYNQDVYKKKNLEKDKNFSLIFVGNLKPRKGFKILIAALKLFKKDELKKLSLSIVTSEFNFKLSKYKKFLLDLPDLKYKIYKGISDDQLSTLYNKSSLNILPSISDDIFFEGFGIIHYEAIASGCLTIGTLFYELYPL